MADDDQPQPPPQDNPFPGPGEGNEGGETGQEMGGPGEEQDALSS